MDGLATTNAARKPAPAWLFPVLAGLILLFEAGLSLLTCLPSKHDLLSLAVFGEISVLVPGLYLLIVVSGRKANPRTLVPVALICVLFASMLLGAAGSPTVRPARWLAVPAEAALVAWVVVRARAGASGSTGDVYDRIEAAAIAIVEVPFIARAIAFEVSLLGWPFIGWQRRPDKDNTFTHHRKGSYSTLMAGLSFAMVLEALPLHFALVRHHPVLAWVLTGASAYAFLWLAGDWRALAVRRTVVEESGIELAVGMRWRGFVPHAAVVRVSPASAEDLKRKGEAVLAVVARGETATVAIETSQPITVKGVYGRARTTKLLLLSPDEPERFMAVCRARVQAGPIL